MDSITQADPFIRSMPNDPLGVRDGATWIMVTHPNHGFIAGEQTTITGAQPNLNDGTINRIPISEINATHTINFPDVDFYFIQVTTSAVGSTTAGKNQVQATSNVALDRLIPNIESLSPANTSIAIQSTIVSQVGRIPQTDALDPALEFNLRQTAVIRPNDTSTAFNAVLSTPNSRVSPLISNQRVSWFATRFKINDPQQIEQLQNDQTGPYADFDIFRDETQEESISQAKYFTNIVQLNDNANSLRVLIDANIPKEYITVQCYYRVQFPEEETPIRDKGWTQLPLVNPIQVSSGSEFREIAYDSAALPNDEWVASPETGTPQELPEYQAVQIKLVLKYDNAPSGSIDTSQVPRIKRLRALALNT